MELPFKHTDHIMNISLIFILSLHTFYMVVSGMYSACKKRLGCIIYLKDRSLYNILIVEFVFFKTELSESSSIARI